jgi:phage terminase large subunit GpA-like protein
MGSLDGEDVFAAECQSAPIKPAAEKDQLESSDILKLSGYPQGCVPPNTAKLTAFVDVQEQSLWYCVCAWSSSYTGYVIDYGVWPDQKRLDVSKTRLRTSLGQKYPLMRNLETRLRAGLADLCDKLLGGTWSDPEGVEHRIACCLVDVGDGDVTVPVSSWIKSSKWSTIIRPSKGLGIGPADVPLEERKKGERELRRGLNWVEMRQQKLRGATMVQFDANWWKSFVGHRWRAASHRPNDDRSYRPAEPGGLYLWGLDAHTHRTFVAHQLSEYTDRLTHSRSGRSCDVWKQRPSHPDNEWFDAIVGCAVAADYAGGISLKDAGLKSAERKTMTGPRKARYF